MRKPPTFRRWLTAAIAALAALGLAAAGCLAYLFELRRTDTRIAGSLQRAVSELHRYAGAHSGASAARLIDGAVAQSVNAADECTLGRAGVATWTHAGAPSVCGRALADPDLAGSLAAPEPRQAVRVWHLTTESGSYVYVAVPVLAGDAVAGVYAVVIDRGAQRAEVGRSYLFGYLPVGLAAVALVAAAGWVTAGRLLRPLSQVAATSREITAGPGGRPDIGRRLDVTAPAEAADLAAAINIMLDSLQTAFEAQRQLLNDVGHELRTPLTVIQGHLELADPGNPDDVEAARTLALDEISRMRRLTNSLVTLAAAEGPGFTRLAAMALGPWFDELVDKARGLGERDWRVEAREEVNILADPHRLTEAMLELAANAVKYSPTGSLVVFALRKQGGWARLSVRDRGQGIDPADHQRVFERFARVDAGGRPGAGLGLAIVAKVAAAHGGRVELRSAPGEGSEFALLVPLAASAPAGPANQEPGDRKPSDRDFSRQDPGRDHPGGGKPIGRNSSGPNGAGQ